MKPFNRQEESLLAIFAKTVALSGSGALSPGPLTASAIALGLMYGWLGGLYVALGHMLFELPYMALLVIGSSFLNRMLQGKRKKILELFAGAFMLFFAYGLLEISIKGTNFNTSTLTIGLETNPLITGLAVGFILTAFNPYFLAWWLTVGQPIVENASNSHRRFAFVYASHVWMDYAWLIGLAFAGGASQFLGAIWYRVLMGSLGAFLLYYSIKFTLLKIKNR